jgi:hypothetical protein
MSPTIFPKAHAKSDSFSYQKKIRPSLYCFGTIIGLQTPRLAAISRVVLQAGGTQTRRLREVTMNASKNVTATFNLWMDYERYRVPIRRFKCGGCGTGVTAYKYKLDNGGWRAETPIETPIRLTGPENGQHTLDVIGKTPTTTGSQKPGQRRRHGKSFRAAISITTVLSTLRTP